MPHQEVPVIITHTVMVDACLAEEIAHLNNDLGISTEYSCCGSGYKRIAFIKILAPRINQMKALGYTQKAPKSSPLFFRPKSRLCRPNERCYHICKEEPQCHK